MLRIRRPTDEPEQQQLQVAELWREIGGIGHQFQLLLNDLRFLEIVRCLAVIFKERGTMMLEVIDRAASNLQRPLE